MPPRSVGISPWQELVCMDGMSGGAEKDFEDEFVLVALEWERSEQADCYIGENEYGTTMALAK